MKRKSVFYFVIICVFIVALMVIDGFLNLNYSKKAASYLNPVGVVFGNAGSSFSGFFSNISRIGTLPKENQKLQDELDRAIDEISRLSAANKENEELRQDLNFKKANKFDTIGAEVVFFDPNNVRETITINVGGSDGIEASDVVLARGYLIGRVKEVTANTAKILLITDPESSIPATLIKSNLTGIAKGKIGGGIIFDQVPQSEKVNIGDIISTSGLGGGFPKGLIIGEIESVQQISGSIFQAIGVRPMINPEKLLNVIVIKD